VEKVEDDALPHRFFERFSLFEAFYVYTHSGTFEQQEKQKRFLPPSPIAEESMSGGTLDPDTGDMEEETLALLQSPVQPPRTLLPEKLLLTILTCRLCHHVHPYLPREGLTPLSFHPGRRAKYTQERPAQDFDTEVRRTEDHTPSALPPDTTGKITDITGQNEPGLPRPAPNLVFPANQAARAHATAPSAATPHAPPSSTHLPEPEGGSSLLTLSRDELAAIIANAVAQAQPNLSRASQTALPLPQTTLLRPTHATAHEPFQALTSPHAYTTTRQGPRTIGHYPTALRHGAPPSRSVALTADNKATPAKVQRNLRAGFQEHVPLHYLTNKKMEQAAYTPAPPAPGLQISGQQLQLTPVGLEAEGECELPNSGLSARPT
ncbi:hypothetical protein H0H87_006342, partial [Tephrocybe sp. NHM501043]